jgi:hypothetical protein
LIGKLNILQIKEMVEEITAGKGGMKYNGSVARMLATGNSSLFSLEMAKNRDTDVDNRAIETFEEQVK